MRSGSADDGTAATSPHILLFALPDGWERFDLVGPEVEATINSRLEERLSEAGVGIADRRTLTQVATRAVRHACHVGVLVWAIRRPVPDLAQLATLTVALNAIPPGGSVPREAPAQQGDPVRYLSAPTDPRPLALLFEGAAGYTREWRLAAEPTMDPVSSLFCVQSVIVSLSSPLVATVTVTAFEPADRDELRTVAATVAGSLRLSAVPAETA